MMKEKLAAALCAALLVGSLSFAAAPATVQDAQKAVYTKSNGSTLTIQYPAVSVAGNAAASQKIAQYFIEEQAKAKAFFDKESMEGMKMTEEKSYVVTLNDGKYLTGERLNWQDLVRPEDAEFFTLDRINAKIFLSKYQLSTYFEGLTELPKNKA